MRFLVFDFDSTETVINRPPGAALKTFSRGRIPAPGLIRLRIGFTKRPALFNRILESRCNRVLQITETDSPRAVLEYFAAFLRCIRGYASRQLVE